MNAYMESEAWRRGIEKAREMALQRPPFNPSPDPRRTGPCRICGRTMKATRPTKTHVGLGFGFAGWAWVCDDCSVDGEL